ncbi:hypothetical protein D1007_03734 [Hordeum vulgare]|nr:hypothetical protein D1007_03734 [Hordeum vulgare]
MASGSGGGRGSADDGRDDSDLSITHSAGRSTLPCSPTLLPGTVVDVRSAVVDGDESGEDGNIFNGSSDNIEARVADKLAQA